MHALILLLFFLLSCGSDDNDSGTGSQIPQQEDLTSEVLIDRDDVVWGFDFLPDKRIIFTERNGKIHILNPDTREVTDVSGGPFPSGGGEDGLLDLRLHPDFLQNQLVYLCYTSPNEEGKVQSLARGVLEGNELKNIEKIFEASAGNTGRVHFGCRIEFENSDKLFLSVGDQGESGQAQETGSHLGKILRLNADGSVPSDNPFVNTFEVRPEIWSLGHRNPQGLVYIHETGQLYSTEHGPTGGDELNLIERGLNYGWPLVTRGTPEGPLGDSDPAFVDPIISWTPAIAPSGITFCRGKLFIATLRGQHIRELTLENGRVTSENILFGDSGLRYRTLRGSSDGLLYFSTDDGKIGRVRFP